MPIFTQPNSEERPETKLSEAWTPQSRASAAAARKGRKGQASRVFQMDAKKAEKILLRQNFRKSHMGGGPMQFTTKSAPAKPTAFHSKGVSSPNAGVRKLSVRDKGYGGTAWRARLKSARARSVATRRARGVTSGLL
jgi:hypothetical protein